MITAITTHLLVNKSIKPFVTILSITLAFFQDVAICYILFGSLS